MLRGIKEKRKKENMKRALIISTVSGFVPQFEMNRVQILKELGYEVHYASNFHNPHYGINNHRLDGSGIIRHQIDFVRSPFRIWRNWKVYWQLRKLIKENSFQLVHCHTPMGGVLGRLAVDGERRRRQRRFYFYCIKNGRKHIKKDEIEKCVVYYTAHGFHFFRGASIINWIFYYPVEWWLAGITDVLITITKEDYQRAKHFKRIAQEQVYHVHGVGVEIETFHKRLQSKEQIKTELGIKKDAILFLSTGELNRNKNHITMIDALYRIQDSRMYYLICGEGQERKRLEKQIQKFRLEKQVFLLGYQENISFLLECADIYVALSYREGLSLGIQEAMAAGLPVLASDIRGNNELILQGRGGWLVKPFDVTTICTILKKLQKSKTFSYIEEKGKFNKERIKEYSKAITDKEMRQIYLENGVEKRKD